jgi:hypothetical protein
MADESNTEALNKEIEKEMLKKVEQLWQGVIHRMLYGPSQEEMSKYKEQMFKDMEKGIFRYSRPIKRF